MYYNYYYEDDASFKQIQDQCIWNELEEQRQENINFISTIVRQDEAENFAKILAAAYEYGNPEAERIANKYGLNQSDFLAIDKNFTEYRKHLIQKGWNV